MSKKTGSLSRRLVLKGIVGGVGVSVALPLLESMLNSNGTALADGTPLPQIFGVWYFGGGAMDETFYPTGTGNTWQASRYIQPLNPHRDYVTIVRGLAMGKTGKLHNCHRAIAMSGSWKQGFTSMADKTYGNPTEPSADQIVAAAWKVEAEPGSLELGVAKGSYQMSWKSGYAVQTAERNARTVFNKLFGNGIPESEGGDVDPKLRAAHLSVLDAVLSQTQSLRNKLGAADWARVDEHLDAIRSIEQRVSNPGSNACLEPALPPNVTGGGDGTGPQNYAAHNELLTDLLAVALACGLTRVFSFQFIGGQPDAPVTEAGVSMNHHSMTHGQDGGIYTRDMPGYLDFVMARLAYFVNKLKSTPFGSGNILDSACIASTTDMLKANKHSWTDHPLLVIGKANGAVKAGHFINANGAKLSSAWLSLLRIAGVQADHFGEPTSQGAAGSSTDLGSLYP